MALRCVAQFGRALDLGSRGCRFKSCRTDLRMSGTENHSRLITLEIAGSTPVSATVAVADLVMRRIVAPEYVGSNPISHL